MATLSDLVTVVAGRDRIVPTHDAGKLVKSLLKKRQGGSK